MTAGLIRQAVGDCTGDCRIMERGAQSGLVGWTPTYDKTGRLLNDEDRITRRYSCLTCGKSMSAYGIGESQC